MLLLFMHVLTHALLGAIIIFFYKDARNYSIPHKIILAIIGGFAGILPDIFGSRASNLWSHSIIFAPILVLPVVLVTKLIFRKLVWWKTWLALSLATIIGHIFIDFLSHEVSLIYPLTQKQYEYVIFEVGDPWVWFPLLILLSIVIFSSKYTMSSILIVLLLVSSYMGVRAYSKYELASKLEGYYGEINEIIVVTPPAENLINIKNPLDYFQWSYDLYSEQRVIRGFSPLFGGSLQNHTNSFYPKPKLVEVNSSGPYRSGDDLPLNVIMEVRESSNYYLICKEINSNDSRVFHQELGGRWNEIHGTEMQSILEYFKENQEK